MSSTDLFAGYTAYTSSADLRADDPALHAAAGARSSIGCLITTVTA